MSNSDEKQPPATGAAAEAKEVTAAPEVASGVDVGADAVKTLLVIDVELSEESGSDVVAREGSLAETGQEQEVVLLAYAILRLDDATAETVTGQLFIKPTSDAAPSPYYTSLTGISKELLDSGVSLSDALDTLHNLLPQSSTCDEKSLCILTDGGRDVDEWLRKDAVKKKIELRSYFKRTLDLKKEFSSWMPDVKEDSLSVSCMLQTVGVAAAGDKACGEVEAKNIAAIAKHMMDAKYVFKPAAPTTTTTTETSQVEAAAATQEEKKTQVIRLRGLPYQVTEEELVEFLKAADPDVSSLYICRGGGGRPTGDAYVKVPPSKLAVAMERSGQRVGHRYAEVFGTTEEEMKDAIQRSESIAAETEALSTDSITKRGPFNMVVKLRGMPFSATPADIEAFFIGVSIDLKDIHICRRMDGRPNGDAYVQLQTHEDVDRCAAFDRKNLGSRYVEVFRSTHAEMLTALGVGTNSLPMGGAGASSGGATLTLRMQGLPFTAREPDVYQFFSGLQIAPNGITFRMNRDGRPSGVAYATFTSADQFEQAKLKHRSMMGSRYIELFPCPNSEVPNMGCGGGGGMPQQQQQGFPPTFEQYQQQRAQHRTQWEAYHRQAKAYYDQNGYGAQYQEFYDQQQRQFQQSDQAAAQYYNTGGRAGGYAQHAQVHGTATVRVKGLPYQTTQVDLSDFFIGYNVGVNDVQIVLGNDGRPSGDAIVRFPDASSAASAVSQLNRQRIGSRYVELFLN